MQDAIHLSESHGSVPTVVLDIHDPGDVKYFAIRGVVRCDTSAASTLAGRQHPPPQESASSVQLPADTIEALLAAKRVISLGI